MRTEWTPEQISPGPVPLTEANIRAIEHADAAERRQHERRHRAEIEERHDRLAFIAAGAMGGQL